MSATSPRGPADRTGRADGSGQNWHASPAQLTAYAGGRTGAAEAWSAEAHLVACPLCRAELAALMTRDVGSGRDAQLMSSVRTRLLDQVTRQPQLTIGGIGRTSLVSRLRNALGRSGAGGSRWHLRWVVRPSSLGAVALAVVAAVAVAAASGWHLGEPGGAHWVLWLVAPAIPLGGVALCSLDDGGGNREAELTTPSAGWRLVLWRSAAVVVTAVPLTLAAAWSVSALAGISEAPETAGGTWLAALWLLPALALVAAALAMGTWVALPRAAAVVGAVWVVSVLAPVLLSSGAMTGPAGGGVGGGVGAALPPTAPGVWSLHLLSGWAQPGWALLLSAALTVVVARREAFGRSPAVAWGRTRGARA